MLRAWGNKRAPVVAVVLSSLLGGCAPALREGVYACTDDAGCPDGWTCSSGRCYRMSSASECRIDLHCDDGSVCTLDICESGRCSHEAQDGSCDDGDFCNGREACSGGLCANVGEPPCPPETCTPSGCGTCGALGSPCCGEVCAGGTCVGGICEACGGDGQGCCAGECLSHGLVCDSGACVPCGGDGQPCCALGACDAPLSCLGTACGPEPGCVGVMCNPGEICSAGVCAPCGKAGQPCCAGGACEEGVCTPPTSTCVAAPACGGPYEPCCATVPGCSDPGFGCSGDDPTFAQCVPCGNAAGAPCCNPMSGFTPCGPGLVCGSLTSACEPCGGSFQRCCDGDVCSGPDTTLLCVASFCRSDCGGRGQRCCAGRCATGLTCNSDGYCA